MEKKQFVDDKTIININKSNNVSKFFISLTGNIGAGKSTLAKSLSTLLNVKLYQEQVADNRYLPDFYESLKNRQVPNPYAFPLEIDMLTTRFIQQQSINWSREGGIQDRSIYEDAIFVRLLNRTGSITDRDFETYSNLYDTLQSTMKRPDALVYLKTKPEIALNRIQARYSDPNNAQSRDMEKGITLDYLTTLNNEYEIEMNKLSHQMPVICIDWNEFREPESIAKMIVNAMKSHTQSPTNNYIMLQN